jgi:uncharacterized protein (TIGR03437 family)
MMSNLFIFPVCTALRFAALLCCLLSAPVVALAQPPNVRAWGYNYDGELGNGVDAQTASRNVPVQVSNLTGMTAIGAGASHSLALNSNGTVWAWGDNEYGQLGNGASGNSDLPVQVSGLTGVTAIAAGWYHSLALLKNGTVWAWGANGSGELGNGTTTSSNVPVQVSGLTAVVAIAAGSGFSLALLNNGAVWAWGDNQYGQLGNGTQTESNVPVQVTGLTGVTAIAAGQQHSLALNSGAVWAWGSNSSAQLGDGKFANSNVPVQVSGLNGVTAIAAGADHSLALNGVGSVWAWGDNDADELGNAISLYSKVPIEVSSLVGAATAIAAGDEYSLAVENGTVLAWGSSALGELGNGSSANNNVPAPVEVSSLTGVMAIAASLNHSMALTSAGTVWAWGDNEYGELGNGSSADSNVPVTVSGLSDVVAVAGGWYHGLALQSDGTAWAWGDNYTGALGNGTFVDTVVPTEVSLNGVVAIAGGEFSSLALKSDGTVWAWGSNSAGELGNGQHGVQVPSVDAPVQVNGLAGIVAIAAGEFECLALAGDGTVWVWAGSSTNQSDVSASPVQLSGLAGVVAITEGDTFGAVLTSDGTVWDFYADAFDTITQVSGLTGVVAIAGGQFGQGLALKSDGTVWTWEYAAAPTQVSGLAGVVAIAARGPHNLALENNGTVWAWGDNEYGELGNGSNVDSSVPVQVSGLTNVSAIAAGEDFSLAVLQEVAPAVTASPASLNFGNVAQGSASTPQTLTIANNGIAPLTVNSTTVMGVNPGDFSISGTCSGVPIASAHTCILKVTFTPGAQGSRSAAVMLTATASGSPILVMLSGTGTGQSSSGGPSINLVLSASDYGSFPDVAPGSWIEIYGTDLAAGKGGWAQDFSGDKAPTLVDGVSVNIGADKAFVAYVSPTQVNVQLPSNITTGGMQQITLTNGTQTSSPYNVMVKPTVPGLLAPASFKIGASQYVVAQHLDGSFVLPVGALPGVTTSPAKPEETIIIYGVGFGSVTPSIPAGEIVTEDNKLSAPITMELAKTHADLGYYGLAPSLVGIYQFNVTVPKIADSDLVPLTFTLGGVAGTQTLFTAVHQ